VVSILLGLAFGHCNLQTILCQPFLWGFLKESIYSNNPQNLEELKNSIEQTVANIVLEPLHIVAHETLKSEDACPLKGGGCFQHLL
jgi:hypothetical protein